MVALAEDFNDFVKRTDQRIAELSIDFKAQYGGEEGHLLLLESLFGKIVPGTGQYDKNGSVSKITGCFNQPAHKFLTLYAMNKLLDGDPNERHDAMHNFITDIKTQDQSTNRPITIEAIIDTVEDTITVLRARKKLLERAKKNWKIQKADEFTVHIVYENNDDSGILPSNLTSIEF